MVDTALGRKLQRAMQQEIRRSLEGLRLPGHPRPFFLSYLTRASEGLSVWGRYGTVFQSDDFRQTDLYAEVRVGSYRFDQSLDGGLNTDLSERESFHWLEGPEELTPSALRYSLWKLTQLKYEEALQDYFEKRKVLVEQHLVHKGADFSRETPVVHDGRLEPVRFPKKRWEEFVREASEAFRGERGLADPFVRIRGANLVRIYANSEGSRSMCQEKYFEVTVKAWHLTADGVYLSSERFFHGRDPHELPNRKAVRAAIRELARDLRQLAKSRPLEPYAGPALLSGQAAGLIFHEAIGHRLEGERLKSRSEGRTFGGKLDTRILPAGCDVFDDPTLARYNGKSLFGHYVMDDEGVPGQRVRLVEDGYLRSFLTSRSSLPGFTRSNGHGRHESYQDPMARMANLIVTSREHYAWDELKEMLCRQVKERGLPYGIIVRGVSGGETRTDRYDFQAFKGVPTAVYTVDPRTGRETRVRDVAFIGTPLAATQHIAAFGRDYEVDNSYCIAESGSLPVSTIAPAMLVHELELQRSTSKLFRRPLLALPKL